MSRKRRHARHPNHERWLVSYADFITLLFAFFVVMYATAQVDKQKMSHLATAIKRAFEEMGALPGNAPAAALEPNVPLRPALPPKPSPAIGPPPGPDNAVHDELAAALAPEIASGAVALHDGPDGLVISLREAGFFPSGSAGFKVGSQAPLARIAAILMERQSQIRIEGHTDNVPIHNSKFNSNWELSTARATEMIRLLIQNYGYDPNKLSAGGYAQYHPIATNATEAGRGLNRRVDLVILRDGVGAASSAHANAAPNESGAHGPSQ